MFKARSVLPVLGMLGASANSRKVEAGLDGGFASPEPNGERDKDAPAARVRRDCAMRCRWEREASIAELKNRELECTRWGYQ